MSRILLFGCGSGMRDFFSIMPESVDIVGLCDNDPRKHGSTVLGYKVYAPQYINELEFEFVIVTTRNGEEIRNQLIELGVEQDRIFNMFACFEKALRDHVNKDIDFFNNILNFGIHRISFCTMPVWPLPLPETHKYEDDYCRMMSLKLTAERIIRNNIQGAVAELGVYKGEFASMLNIIFPDRKLYLFDTFKGFNDNDVLVEQKNYFSSASTGEFNDTNIELVIGRMTHPDRVVVCQGYFPETAKDLNTTFAFVSIDVDLYKPTLAGLEYFYPRLCPGGCIFVHDYNNRRFMGVKKAVEEFCLSTGAPLTLLPDYGGTAILPK